MCLVWGGIIEPKKKIGDGIFNWKLKYDTKKNEIMKNFKTIFFIENQNNWKRNKFKFFFLYRLQREKREERE